MPPLSATPAQALANQLFQNYGLQFDNPTIQHWLELLSDDPNNMALIEEEIRQSPQFAGRFPGIAQRLEAGLPAISPAQYLQLEQQYTSIMRNSGMPRHFWDQPDDFARFIANDVSPVELEARVVDGLVAAQQAPPEVLMALEDFYGIQNSQAALAAYFLDPERGLSVIQQQFNAAQIAGVAQQTNFGGINREQAEHLGSLGLSGNQTREGFSQLAQNRELTVALPGEKQGGLTVDQQLRAIFEGDEEILSILDMTRQRRAAQFTGISGGASATQEGFVGLQSTAR